MSHPIKNLRNQIVGLVACDDPTCPENSKVDLNQIFGVPPSPDLLDQPQIEPLKPKKVSYKSQSR